MILKQDKLKRFKKYNQARTVFLKTLGNPGTHAAAVQASVEATLTTCCLTTEQSSLNMTV
jgi:hypothetical protein